MKGANKINTEDKALLNAIVRKDFKSFVRKVFNEVSANNEYLDNWHIDVICDSVMTMMESKDNNRLIVNIPPRYLKSIICSIALPAFLLGHNPKANIICVSYGDELSSKFAHDTKRVIESIWYQELFPSTKIAKDKKSINDFATTKGGGRFATSVNGTLTGRGADHIIIDDPIKPTEALSDKIRDKTNEWFGNTLYSRLNNKNTGKILLIMQRVHENDLTGHLLDSEQNFSHLRMPAIAENDELWEVKDRIRDQVYKISRRKGDPLHKEREGIDLLLKTKNSIGEFAFAGQYQQLPMPQEGGLIKKRWLQYYNEKDSIQFTKILMSWDTANKSGVNNAYSVCLTLGVTRDNKYYLLDCYREKLDFPDLIKQVLGRYNKLRRENKCPVLVLIEDKASGTQIIQTLKAEHHISPIEVKPEYDKETRLKSISHLLENGTCLFPKDNPHWWFDFELELLRFPSVQHSDQCDALSQTLLSRDAINKTNKTCVVGSDRLRFKNGHCYVTSSRKANTNPKRDITAATKNMKILNKNRRR